jgi:predicted transcriptional regulator
MNTNASVSISELEEKITTLRDELEDRLNRYARRARDQKYVIPRHKLAENQRAEVEELFEEVIALWLAAEGRA